MENIKGKMSHWEFEGMERDDALLGWELFWVAKADGGDCVRLLLLDNGHAEYQIVSKQEMKETIGRSIEEHYKRWEKAQRS